MVIFGINLLTFVGTVGILGVAFLVFAESGLLVGFFLPGDSVLFAAGLLINSGVLRFPIVLAIALFFVASTLGNAVGYLFGLKAGPRIFNKQDARLFKREYIERAQSFYEERGAFSIVLARFIPVVRTFAPIVAGAGAMPFRRFIVFNIAGGLVWTAGVTLLGYFLGTYFASIGLPVDRVILPLVGGIIVISVLPAVLPIVFKRERRASFVRGMRRELRTLFRKSR